MVSAALEAKALERRCVACNRACEFHFEDGETFFATMQEAMPHLIRIQQEIIQARRFLAAARN